MKKILVLIIAFSVFLASCANIIDPTKEPSPNPQLTGTWFGTTTTPGYDDHTETYIFYNNSKIERKRFLSWSSSAPEIIGGGDSTATWHYQWIHYDGGYWYRAYNFNEVYSPFDIDLTNIKSGKITIDGVELTKQ